VEPMFLDRTTTETRGYFTMNGPRQADRIFGLE